MSLIKRCYKWSIRAKELECEISGVDLSLLYQNGRVWSFSLKSCARTKYHYRSLFFWGIALFHWVICAGHLETVLVLSARIKESTGHDTIEKSKHHIPEQAATAPLYFQLRTCTLPLSYTSECGVTIFLNTVHPSTHVVRMTEVPLCNNTTPGKQEVG
jgi:hypothetical protein